MPEQFRFPKAPIIEAVVDIDCDYLPKFSIIDAEVAATKAFSDVYPKRNRQHVQEVTIQVAPDSTPSHKLVDALGSLQFSQPDGKQLVQVRTGGFSFNRLAPYGGLDDYLPEIERTWEQFVAITKPVQVRVLRLRYINRILLPLDGTNVDLDRYLSFGPKMPNPNDFVLVGFLNQNSFQERETGFKGNTVLTAQPLDKERLPIIFDITVEAHMALQPTWKLFVEKILSLRRLKNSIFNTSLTTECLNLFQ